MRIVNPAVKIEDYGPKRVVFDSYGKIKQVITPDEEVAAASGVTFKDTRYFSEAILKIINGDFGNVEGYRKDLLGLVRSAGAGHASISTTPYLWVSVEGDASKMIDSLFSSARYGSFLMPSGRRIPIKKDAIVVPREISERGQEAVDLYVGVSERNIEAYERLQEMGIPKEEAAKIVQYGHLGGGFLSFPLETLVWYRRNFERNRDAIPREGFEVLSQLEEIVKNNGMTISYVARLLSPRETCTNPSIFHYDENETADVPFGGHSFPIEDKNKITAKFLSALLELREKVCKTYTNEQGIEDNWRNISGELQQICERFPNAIDLTVASNIPWRVWGEVKRHRTLMQSAESIYAATDRAVEFLKSENPTDEEIKQIFSFRPVIANNPQARGLWLERFRESMLAYQRLINSFDVAPPEALYVVPRGLKLKVIKKFDTWNALQGYIPLRLCQTAEGEMREITEVDAEILKSSLPSTVASFINPKCHITGHCHDGVNGKYCGKILEAVPFYNEEFDQRMKRKRKEEILDRIKE